MTPVPAMGGPAGLRGRDLGVSVLFHVMITLLLASSRACQEESAPLFDPQDVMNVEMVALPKATGRNPDRATRAPRPPEGSRTAEAPPADPDQMVVPQEQTEEQPSGASTPSPDAQARRDELLRDLRREQLVKQMDASAPLGDRDRLATDPDSTLSPDAVGWGSGSGTPMDPELARYIVKLRQRILPHWTPLPRLIRENPDIETVVGVWLDPDGVVQVVRVLKDSGSASYDQSCLRAVRKAARLPLPPDKYLSKLNQGIAIRFPASDAG